MLTTGELIKWLKQFPPDTEIIPEYFEQSNVIDIKVFTLPQNGLITEHTIQLD